MHDVTQVGTLRMRARDGGVREARLRLSAQLSGADICPPGLAPSQLLLVRHISDPSPGRLRIDETRPNIDRSWERAVRTGLGECLRRAVRPKRGRVPRRAGAVLFRNPSEAWACWSRERIRRHTSAAPPWWMESLPYASDILSFPGGQFPRVADAWHRLPRLVPAMTAYLSAWDVVVDVMERISERRADGILDALCTAFGVDIPGSRTAPPEERDGNKAKNRRQARSIWRPERINEPFPGETWLRAPRVAEATPPWTSFVERCGRSRLSGRITSCPPALRELLGIALTLSQHPPAVRAPAFRERWKTWRSSVVASPHEAVADERKIPVRRPDPYVSGQGGPPPPDGEAMFYPRKPSEYETSRDGSRADHDRGENTPETTPPARREAAWSDSFTGTDIGGVLYLVNLLHALDLPGVVRTPPIDRPVGAWAVLEAVARTFLGPGARSVHPDDPLWRLLADLEGRTPDVPAGWRLDEALEAGDRPVGVRIPAAWLDQPDVASPVHGRWTVMNGRLHIWTDVGSVADLPASEAPQARAKAEWNRYSNAGHLQHVDNPDRPLHSPEPRACGQVLRRWTSLAAPYMRHRLAAAIGVDDHDSRWLTDLLCVPGRIYATETHIDLVLPLDAARTDVRASGLDRSPGWWAAGGRVVRFYFQPAKAAHPGSRRNHRNKLPQSRA